MCPDAPFDMHRTESQLFHGCAGFCFFFCRSCHRARNEKEEQLDRADDGGMTDCGDNSAAWTRACKSRASAVILSARH